MSYLRRRRAPAARPATLRSNGDDSARLDWIEGLLPGGSAPAGLAPAVSLPAPELEILFTPRALRRRARSRK